MKQKKCEMCSKVWIVSVKDKQKIYVCPVCERYLRKAGKQ